MQQKTASLNSQISPGIEVITLGETMMAFEALEPGPLRETRHFKKWIGGAEDNFAIGLARLGIGCGWISRLGTDEFGREILRTIRGEGVDTSRVIQDSRAQTGVFFCGAPHRRRSPLLLLPPGLGGQPHAA